MEKRAFPRTDCDISLTAEVNGKELWCNVKNLSVGGALLEVHRGHEKKISRRHLGKPVNFLIYTDLPSIVNYRGKVVRYKVEEGKKMIGVQFFDLMSYRDDGIFDAPAVLPFE